ncbi:hypothetical protein ACFW15_31920, partial [Streptomyces sp. NPDC058953]
MTGPSEPSRHHRLRALAGRAAAGLRTAASRTARFRAARFRTPRFRTAGSRAEHPRTAGSRAEHPRTARSREIPGLGAAPGPWARAGGLVVVALLGAWLGLLAVGSVHTRVGPMETSMTLRPDLSGGTRINVSPLGALDLDSHTAPLRLDVDVEQLDPARST